MPITAVSAEVITADLHTPFVTAVRSTSQVESVLVRVTDSEGNHGCGEGPQTWKITGESLRGIVACVEGPLRQAVLGFDPDDVNAALDAADAAVVGNRVAKAALDVALHDLTARRAGLPLVRLLGGSRTTVDTDVTLAAGEIPQLVEAAKARVSEGFSHLKVKVGTDPGGDLARLKAIREVVGSDVTIRVDANQGWNAKQAIRIVRGMEDSGLDIELVEQPTPARHIDALADVTRAVDTTILADESVFTITDLFEVIRTRAADAVNVKLAKCGGLRAGRTMLEIARQYGVDTMIGSMMEGRVGVAAAASLAAASSTSFICDLDAAWWLANDDEALAYRAGQVSIGSGPGLSALDRLPYGNGV